MRANLAVAATAAVLAALTAVGCKSKTERFSDSDYILGLLNDAWATARESMQSSKPQVGRLYSVHVILVRRLPRRVKMDYTRPNKQQVLAKLQALVRDYEAAISSKLEVTGGGVQMRPGVTIGQLREGFMKLDKDYRELQSMTRD